MSRMSFADIDLSRKEVGVTHKPAPQGAPLGMPEPRTALNGARFEGYVRVCEMPPQGMVRVRGSLSDRNVAGAIRQATGAPVPRVRKIATGANAQSVAWMAPDEALILVAYDAAPSLAETVRVELGDTHALVAVVSDGWTVLNVEGAGADEVLAKLAPVDTARLAPDEVRRTRLAQAGVTVWRAGGGLRVACARSLAGYVFDVLCAAARPGTEVFANRNP